jgi:hypothetical protein
MQGLNVLRFLDTDLERKNFFVDQVITFGSPITQLELFDPTRVIAGQAVPRFTFVDAPLDRRSDSLHPSIRGKLAHTLNAAVVPHEIEVKKQTSEPCCKGTGLGCSICGPSRRLLSRGSCVPSGWQKTRAKEKLLRAMGLRDCLETHTLQISQLCVGAGWSWVEAHHLWK